MRHYTNPRFWKFYETLPADIQRLAKKNFQLLKRDPRHPSLRLKKINSYWTARIGLDYRVAAIESKRGLVWFWIGDHQEYEQMLS